MKHVFFVGLTWMLAFYHSSNALDLFGIGPRMGYYKSEDADQGKMYGGATARLKLGGLGFEGSIDYREENYEDNTLKLKSIPLSASVLIYPVPLIYGIAGIGWYNTSLEYRSQIPGSSKIEENHQEVGYHFGGGVELPLGNISIAADIRYVFLDYNFKVSPTSDKIKADFYAITLALLWGF